MRTQVSLLAQAIGTYANGQGAPDAPSALQLSPVGASGASSPGSTGASLAVVSMVDVMKQFDANGNLLGSSVATAAPTATSLTVPGLQNPNTTGILASGGKS
jgi:hypothetical protein